MGIGVFTESKPSALPTVNDRSMVRSILLQRFASRLALPILSLILISILKFKGRYSFKRLSEIRREFASLNEDCKGPMLICPNHLTMIDSVLLLWAFGSPFYYISHFHTFAWNSPAVEHFSNSILKRIITYLGKCIPINRMGTEEHINSVLEKMVYLLNSGDRFMIFPEGMRSRTGRVEVEEVAYGVGKIASLVPEISVLCVYLRGDKQTTFSDIPSKGDCFDVSMRLIHPTTDKTGLRAHRDISQKIINTIKDLEDAYFASK